MWEVTRAGITSIRQVLVWTASLLGHGIRDWATSMFDSSELETTWSGGVYPDISRTIGSNLQRQSRYTVSTINEGEGRGK